MSGQTSVPDEKLLVKLVNAFEEAWTKLQIALEQTPDEPREFELAVHFAAEAAEYTSFLFSLTYGLEDFNPLVKVDKKLEPLPLVKDSIEPLRKARELRGKSPMEAYTHLRTAAERLQVATVKQIKKRTKKAK